MARPQRFAAEWRTRAGDWHVELRFGKSDGRVELTGLEIKPIVRLDRDEEPPILTATLLRQIPLGRFVSEWRTNQRRMNREAIEVGAVKVTSPRGQRLPTDEAIDFLDQLAGVSESKAGRPTYWTRERLAAVARVYRAAWECGDNPTAAVFKAGLTSSLSMAAKAVALARHKAGLLPKTTRGRAGLGRRTPSAKSGRKERR